MNLDDRFEWVEISTLDGTFTVVRGACLHRDLVDVYSLTGDLVAKLCPDCDTQITIG